MLKRNKWKLIVSSIIILLPIVAGLLLWNQLPDNMVTHWGADGNPDEMTPKHTAIFIIPTVCLAVHWLCLWGTSLDKKHQDRNEKAMRIIFWIIPVLSVAVSAMMYAIALGKTFAIVNLVPVLIAILFLAIGNYMPKLSQNKTIGIKVYWTLGNEENWNKTHRLAGKVWVIGGLLLLFSALLPMKIMIAVLICTMFPMIGIPIVYSYCLYKKHRKAGVVYTTSFASKQEKKVALVGAVIVPIILIGVCIVMFTGGVKITYEESSFTVDASYWSDIKIDYQQIEEIEYLDNFDGGYRVSGFASAKLALGQFKNDQLGDYIAYLNVKCDACVIVRSEGNVLVLNGADERETKVIYDTLLSKIQ